MAQGELVDGQCNEPVMEVESEGMVAPVVMQLEVEEADEVMGW